MVRPWSPIWVVAAMATSSTRSGGSCGLRRSSSRMQRMTRSSARVLAYMPPALPNGVRTPSTKTTSRTSRGTESLLGFSLWRLCYWLVGFRRLWFFALFLWLQRLRQIRHEQFDLPAPGAEAGQRLAHRVDAERVGRRP